MEEITFNQTREMNTLRLDTHFIFHNMVKNIYEKNTEEIILSQKENGTFHLQYEFINHILLEKISYFKDVDYTKIPFHTTLPKQDSKNFNIWLKDYELRVNYLDGDLFETMKFIFENIKTIE